MKLKSLALACALAFAGQAYAVGPTVTPDVQLFLSGSSALQNAIGQIELDMCATGTIDEYWDGTTGAGSAASGKSYRAYYCTFKTGTTTSGITIPASLGGKNVLLYNTAAGGSIMGINPVALALPVNRLDIATCAFPATVKADTITGVASVYSCPGVVATAVPDAGVSDTEPSLFTGINLAITTSTALTTRTPSTPALSAAQLSNLATTTAVGQAMGIVTTSNINATPGALNLSKAQVESLMDGKLNVYDWNQVVPSVAAGTSSIIVCRRQPGSGTQSSINAAIFGFPCSSSSLVPADARSTTAVLGSTTPVAPGNYVVIENNASGDVVTCINTAQAGSAAGKAIDVTTGAIVTAGAANSVVLPANSIAIGVLGFDKTLLPTDTANLVSINGAAPTLANAVNGVYDIMVENSFQIRKATTGGIPVLSGGPLDLYNTFVKAAGTPAVLGTTGHIVAGVAALSENGAIAPATFNASTPVMKVGNGGNTCTPLYQLQ